MGKDNSAYQFAGVRFEADSGLLTSAEHSCKLEPKAADVLTLLLREQGMLVSRERLLERCWADGAGSDEALTQTIAQIRRSFEALGLPRDILTTYPKRGYRLAKKDASAPHRPRGTAKWLGMVLIASVVALLVVLAVFPHWPRHVIRHALGLGPNQAHHHSGRMKSSNE